MHATSKDLRFHTKELLDTVERGEEVIITYRGKPRAKLIPIQNENSEFDDEENHLFGIWEDNDSVQNVDEYVRKLRKGRY